VEEGEEDRSKWKYEDGGRPLEVATRFVAWLQSPERIAEDGQAMATKASWPAWQRWVAAPTEERIHSVREITHFSLKVRYPAGGMAYVLCPITHPDQDEALIVTEPAQAWMNVVTLLFEGGDWKVHQVGRMLPPAEVGLQAYSW
jgi:hypothetical protein